MVGLPNKPIGFPTKNNHSGVEIGRNSIEGNCLILLISPRGSPNKPYHSRQKTQLWTKKSVERIRQRNRFETTKNVAGKFRQAFPQTLPQISDPAWFFNHSTDRDTKTRCPPLQPTCSARPDDPHLVVNQPLTDQVTNGKHTLCSWQIENVYIYIYIYIYI